MCFCNEIFISFCLLANEGVRRFIHVCFVYVFALFACLIYFNAKARGESREKRQGSEEQAICQRLLVARLNALNILPRFLINGDFVLF